MTNDNYTTSRKNSGHRPKLWHIDTDTFVQIPIQVDVLSL